MLLAESWDNAADLSGCVAAILCPFLRPARGVDTRLSAESNSGFIAANVRYRQLLGRMKVGSKDDGTAVSCRPVMNATFSLVPTPSALDTSTGSR